MTLIWLNVLRGPPGVYSETLIILHLYALPQVYHPQNKAAYGYPDDMYL